MRRKAKAAENGMASTMHIRARGAEDTPQISKVSLFVLNLTVTLADQGATEHISVQGVWVTTRKLIASERTEKAEKGKRGTLRRRANIRAQQQAPYSDSPRGAGAMKRPRIRRRNRRQHQCTYKGRGGP